MLFGKKKAPDVQEPMDLDSVMKKFDRESNTRVWEGAPKIVIQCILAFFSVFCLYVTLFANWLDELRLATFVAYIVLMGYLVFPARKGKQRVNYLPWYDILLMLGGAGTFFYYAMNAVEIAQQSVLEPFQVVLGVIAILSLA